MLRRVIVFRARLLTSTLLGVFVCLASFVALAQIETPHLSKVTEKPINPFVSKNGDTTRGSPADLLAGKKLPRWKNLAEFTRATLPQDVTERRREEWVAEAVKMESVPGFRVRRMLDTLQIRIKDGRFIYFLDQYSGSGEYRQVDIAYIYAGYNKEHRFHFVVYYWYEDGGAFAVSADTGLIWQISSIENWSPDNSRMAGLGVYADVSDLIVLRLKDGAATYELFETGSPFIDVLNRIGVGGLAWLDDKTLYLSSQDRWISPPSPQIILQLTDHGWQARGLEPFSTQMKEYGWNSIPLEWTPSSTNHRINITSDPVHGRVNVDWLCIFEGRLC